MRKREVNVEQIAVRYKCEWKMSVEKKLKKINEIIRNCQENLVFKFPERETQQRYKIINLMSYT